MNRLWIALPTLLSLPAMAEPRPEAPLNLERELTASERRHFAAPLIASCDAVISKAAKAGHANCHIADRAPVEFDRLYPDTLIDPSGFVGVAGAAPWAWDAIVECPGVRIDVSLHATPVLRSRAWQQSTGRIDQPEGAQWSSVISHKVAGDDSDFEFSSATVDEKRIFQRVQIGALVNNQEAFRNPQLSDRAPAMAKPVAVVISLLASGEMLQNFVDVEAIRSILARAESTPPPARIDEPSGVQRTEDERHSAEIGVYAHLLARGKVNFVRALTDSRPLPGNILASAPRIVPDIRPSELQDYAQMNHGRTPISRDSEREGIAVELVPDVPSPGHGSGDWTAFSRVGFSNDLAEAVVYQLSESAPAYPRRTLYFLVRNNSGWTTRYAQTLDEVDGE